MLISHHAYSSCIQSQVKDEFINIIRDFIVLRVSSYDGEEIIFVVIKSFKRLLDYLNIRPS